MNSIYKLYNQNKFIEAEHNLEKYIKKNGLEITPFKLLIDCLYKNKKIEKTLEYIDFLLLLEPLDHEIIKLKIKVLKQKKEFMLLSEYIDYLSNNLDLDFEKIFNSN